MGVARGRGAQVVVPQKSKLVDGKLYGWEYAMHIGRQELEARLRYLEQVERDGEGLVNNISGAIRELSKPLYPSALCNHL